MGLLGNGFDDPQSAAIMALAGGLLQGNLGQGLLGANDAFAAHKANALKQQLLQAQIGESQAAAQERAMKIKAAEEAQAAAIRKREAFPTLFRQPGMTGGQAMPQELGGVPMFSKPMGAAPMQATAGGFDPQAAIQAGYTLDEIPKLAALQNLNRPKATRQMEVDDGRGGKRIALVDDYGQEVAGFAGYTAPVQVNRGGSVDFVKPEAGTSLPMTMSFSDRSAAANLALSRQRLALDQGNAEQGKWQYDAQRGGLVNMQSGEFKPAMQGGQPIETKASREAAKEGLQRRSAIENAGGVLKEVQDAKGMVGWDTAGVGGSLAFLPATDARNLGAKLQTIKANLGFDRLQQMRADSPTGGALGQVAVQELAALQATVASLDQMQSPAQLGTALDKIETHYTKWKNVMEQANSGQGGASGGWGIKEKK